MYGGAGELSQENWVIEDIGHDKRGCDGGVQDPIHYFQVRVIFWFIIFWCIVLLYAFSLLYIFLFSLGQLHLAWIYARRKDNTKNEEPPGDFFPRVTIQLPIYNEKYVVERLLKAVANIEYPKEKLQIQILDDSTDETTEMISERVATLRLEGVNISVLHRDDRVGFKAGALDHGLQHASGDFIAIFDADFVPTPHFLLQTIPYFQNEKLGVVQTRWGHINQDFSVLTQLQAFGLDAHFSIEQTARNAAGSYINFNGTCGVWRKKCIEDAGGWSADTLTEDLDLSYRAQLKGWSFKYLEDVSTPGELPVIMPAVKSQQYRWNKGGAETARKLLGQVFASDLPFINKVHAFLHLFNSSVFVFLFVAGLLSVPMLYVRKELPGIEWLFDVGMVFLIGFFSITLFYWIATKRFYAQPLKSFIWLYPQFLIVSMGLSLHNGIAVVEGWMGRRTPFVRTPKFNVIRKGDSWRRNLYASVKLDGLMFAEGLLCLYFIFGIVLGVMLKDPALIFFHVMLALGFGAVCVYSLKPLIDARH